jgi:hypothetical protein
LYAACAAEFAGLSAEEIALLKGLLRRVLDSIATYEQRDDVGRSASIAQ